MPIDRERLADLIAKNFIARSAVAWNHYQQAFLRDDASDMRKAYEEMIALLRPLFRRERYRGMVMRFLRETEDMPIRAVVKRLTAAP